MTLTKDFKAVLLDIKDKIDVQAFMTQFKLDAQVNE